MIENRTPYIKTQNLDKASIRENLMVKPFTRNGEKWELHEPRSQFNRVEREAAQTHSQGASGRDGDWALETHSGVDSGLLLQQAWLLMELFHLSVCSSANQGSHCFLKGLNEMALVVKNPPANARVVRDEGSISGSRRSPGGGNGHPFQDSWLENPMDRGSWQATVHGVAKSWTELKRLNMHACLSEMV